MSALFRNGIDHSEHKECTKYTERNRSSSLLLTIYHSPKAILLIVSHSEIVFYLSRIIFLVSVKEPALMV